MKKMLILTTIVAIAAVVIIACNSVESKVTITSKNISQDSLVKRGKYLVTIMGCNDCHSPKVMGPMGPEPDTSRLLSGHIAEMPIGKIDTTVLKSWVLFNYSTTAMAGQWGVSYAANLTSDSTGVGNWTEKQFFKAIREGKYKGLDGGRMLLPPMPWPVYAQATDDDLKAIFAFLKSTKPIKNLVPAPIPPTEMIKKG